MSLVVWIDEEVGSFSRVTRKLRARGITLREELSAGAALAWHTSGHPAAGESPAILIVDMMLAPGDHAPDFSAANTQDYMLTGLTLLSLLETGGHVKRYHKVVVYTALKDEQYLSRVHSWIAPRNTARSTDSSYPVYEVRSKANFDHDDMLSAILEDLGEA